MSTTCTPATSAPVEVTTTARAAGLRPGFRVVMIGDAYHRARAHSEHPDPDDGVRAVVDALTTTLTALIDHDRALTTGTTWAIHTGHVRPDRWTVLVTVDENDPAAVALYIAPA